MASNVVNLTFKFPMHDLHRANESYLYKILWAGGKVVYEKINYLYDRVCILQVYCIDINILIFISRYYLTIYFFSFAIFIVDRNSKNALNDVLLSWKAWFY